MAAKKRNDPNAMAREAAEKYIAGITDDLLWEDTSPGDVSLEAEVDAIKELLLGHDADRDSEDAEKRAFAEASAAARAGYIVGVQVGLRLRAVR